MGGFVFFCVWEGGWVCGVSSFWWERVRVYVCVNVCMYVRTHDPETDTQTNVARLDGTDTWTEPTDRVAKGDLVPRGGHAEDEAALLDGVAEEGLEGRGGHLAQPVLFLGVVGVGGWKVDLKGGGGRGGSVNVRACVRAFSNHHTSHALHHTPATTDLEALEEGAGAEVGLDHGVAGPGRLRGHPLAGAAGDGGGHLQARAQSVLVEAVQAGMQTGGRE